MLKFSCEKGMEWFHTEVSCLTCKPSFINIKEAVLIHSMTPISNLLIVGKRMSSGEVSKRVGRGSGRITSISCNSIETMQPRYSVRD